MSRGFVGLLINLLTYPVLILNIIIMIASAILLFVQRKKWDKKKKILVIVILIISLAIFLFQVIVAIGFHSSAHPPDFPDPLEETSTPRSNVSELEENPVPNDAGLPENRWHEITGSPIDEERFIENLDVSTLEMIAGEIQSLVAEIGEKERADPDFVLQGKWNEYFRSSEQYKLVLELGLRAVKPAYYIIYKSPQSGLYEYILASAIDEITGYDYSVTESYGWSTSKQFLEMYNEKVSKTLTSCIEILDNPELEEAEKSEQIRVLGIFAVAPLLNEIDNPSSNLSGESLEACLWSIIKNYSGEDVTHNLDRWRSENEQTYLNIIEILE